jgi:hypothetical protein
MGQTRWPGIAHQIAIQPTTLATLNTRTGPKRPTPPREWICYHNPDEMGYSAEAADPHSEATGKKRLNPRNLIGDRIWLVGRDEGTDKYYLHGYFVVDSFNDQRQAQRGVGARKLSLRGKQARQFRRRVRIDRESWFHLYKDTMNQLSLGLQSVKESQVIDGLFDALRKHRVSAV